MTLLSLGMLALGFFAGSVSPRHFGFYPCAAVALFVYFGFGRLTVEADAEAVRLTFGNGLFRKEFRFCDISSARAVKNPWWWGLGIKYIGNGWLYNVAGPDAVELTLRNGRRARIGTDEPLVLEREIQSRIK